jgi:hypothetical protein
VLVHCVRAGDIAVRRGPPGRRRSIPYRQIADAMILAEKTVKNYISNLSAKLGVECRTQAATFAARINERSVQAARIDDTGT